jgi:phage baseplate assembly protein W
MSIRKPLPSARNKPTEKYTLVNSDLKEYYDLKKSKKRYSGVYGLSPKLPLSIAQEGSYTLLIELKDVVKQNFKNLVLTEPGERIMNPSFGVGLAAYLFEQKGTATEEEIRLKILDQVSIYMPYLNIDDVLFQEDEQELNYLKVAIYYSIPNLNIEDTISVSIEE